LNDGLILNHEIRCPWHHACFDIKNGDAIKSPALSPLPTWNVEIKNDFDSEKYSFTSVYGYYKFEAALKGLKVGVEYEDKGKDADGQDLWVKAGYKF
jgi:hypothetical protein